MKLAALQERRSAVVDEMKGLVNKANDAGRDMTADETKRFEELKGEERSLQSSIERAEYLREIERRAAGAPADDTRDFGKLERDVSILKVIRAQVEGRSLDGAELEYSKEIERRTGRKAEGAFVPMQALETRVNETTSASQLVPTQHRPNDYIGALRNALYARRLGVRVLGGLSGNVSIPKYKSGLTTGWIAEGEAVPEGNMAFQNITLTPKHVGGKTEMSRQLIQQSSPAIEQLVRDDLTALIAQQIDSAILTGSGTGAEPQGIIGATGVKTAALPTTWEDVLALSELLALDNLDGVSWLMAPGVRTTLASTEIVTGSGSGFLLQNGAMDGKSAYVTNQMPAGQLLLGDFSQVFLGIWSELDILVNPYAEPAYSRGGIQVRAMATIDTALRYPEAFVVAGEAASA